MIRIDENEIKKLKCPKCGSIDIEDTKKELKRITKDVPVVVQLGIIPDYTCSKCSFMWMIKNNKVIELKGIE